MSSTVTWLEYIRNSDLDLLADLLRQRPRSAVASPSVAPGPRRVWLGVWSGNTGAQRFYARRGFQIVGEHTYAVGDTIDEEYAMRRG